MPIAAEGARSSVMRGHYDLVEFTPLAPPMAASAVDVDWVAISLGALTILLLITPIPGDEALPAALLAARLAARAGGRGVVRRAFRGPHWRGRGGSLDDLGRIGRGGGGL